MLRLQTLARTFLRLAPLIAIITLTVLLYRFASPEVIIGAVGVENAYLLMFITAFLGGMVIFNGVPYYSLLMVLATGGLSPLALGIASALGVMTGDSTSYYLGYSSAGLLPTFLQKAMGKVEKIIERYPRRFPIICFFYGACSPFSNDFLTIPAGALQYSYWRMILPLALGNIVFNVAIAYLSVYAYDDIVRLFGAG